VDGRLDNLFVLMASSRWRAVVKWWQSNVWGRHKVLVLFVAFFALGAILLGGYVLVVRGRLTRIDVALPGSKPGGTTYLIVGTDSRVGVPRDQQAVVGSVQGERADLVLILRVFRDGSPPMLLSVPRDLLVLENDRGLHRLTLTWLSGPQTTVDSLCESLGIGADHLVKLDLAGFNSVVEAVGGVDVHLPAPIHDEVLNFDLPAGTVHLDGAMAMSYVRARHLETFNGVDWVPVPNDRAEQARDVLIAVARKAKPSVTHPLEAHRLVWALSGALAVDRGTGLRDLWRLADALRAVETSVDDALPATIDDSGPIPYAELTPGAAEALRRAGAGGRGCPHAALPEAGVVSVPLRQGS